MRVQQLHSKGLTPIRAAPNLFVAGLALGAAPELLVTNSSAFVQAPSIGVVARSDTARILTGPTVLAGGASISFANQINFVNVKHYLEWSV